MLKGNPAVTYTHNKNKAMFLACLYSQNVLGADIKTKFNRLNRTAFEQKSNIKQFQNFSHDIQIIIFYNLWN